MKILPLLLLPLLAGCAGWTQVTEAMFGPNTKNTFNLCDDDGKCTKIVIKGDQSDMANVINILAQKYGLEMTTEPDVPVEE